MRDEVEGGRIRGLGSGTMHIERCVSNVVRSPKGGELLSQQLPLGWCNRGHALSYGAARVGRHEPAVGCDGECVHCV